MLGPAELIRKRIAMPLSPPRQGESLTTDFLPAANLMHIQETFNCGGISAVAYRSVVDRRYIIAQGDVGGGPNGGRFSFVFERPRLGDMRQPGCRLRHLRRTETGAKIRRYST